MPIINQVVAGSGGGGGPAHYVELNITSGALSRGAVNNLDFSSATSIPNNGLFYAFAQNSNVVGSVDLSNITSVGSNGFDHAFYYTGITYINMSSIETIAVDNVGDYAFRNTKLVGFDFSNLKTFNSSFRLAFADNPTLVGVFSFPKLEFVFGFRDTFANDTGITFFGFPKLKTIGKPSSSQGFMATFNDCTSMVGVNLNALEKIDGTNQQMQNAFNNTKLVKISFPMLTTVSTNSFHTSAFTTTTLTEIHFRKDMQATIEAMSGYSTKWGASNATVYFDLVGTLTGADGNTYTRDEYNSVYSDQHGQFQTAVAWKYNDTTYYTPAGAEPAVSDAIYSDAACTQSVTTITAIA